MNLYAVIILAVLLGEFALSVVSSVLNLRALHPILPAKFEDVFDADRYAQSQRYTRSQTMLGLVRRSVSLAAVFAVWQRGGFGWLDQRLTGARVADVVEESTSAQAVVKRGGGVLIRSPRRLRKRNRWPETESRAKRSHTSADRPSIDFRQSVAPVAT